MDTSDPCFIVTQKLLAFAGLWHSQTYRERLLRYCILGFMSLYCVCGELCQILTLDLNLTTAVRTLQIFIPFICAATMYYTAILHFITINKIYNYIQLDWQRLKDETELKIMQKHSHTSKLFVVTIGLMFYLYMLISISPSLLRIVLSTNEVRSDIDHYPIISCIDYFLDQETYYYPIVTCQVITSFIILTIWINLYAMYFAITQHACAHLSIIKYKIYCPFICKIQNDDSLKESINFTHWIIDIVQHLARITEFMSLVNTLSVECYLIQIFLAFILLVIDFLCLFQISVLLEQKENMKDILELIIFVFANLFVIYVNCYVGQRLMDYSTDVYTEACLVPIYKISVKIQKLLLTTLMINSKPCVISIGNVFVASNEFFSSLLRSSLSFAMVLRSLHEI